MNKLKSFKKIKINNYNVKKIRDSETVSKKDFIQIGRKTYFHFPDSFKDQVFNKGGFKHPSNPKLIRCFFKLFFILFLLFNNIILYKLCYSNILYYI